MLIIKKTNAYLGLILAMISISVAPMLKVPVKGNWNLYEADPRLLYISLAILALTAFCLLLKLLKGFRLFAYAFAAWGVIMAAAVYFNVNNYLSDKVILHRTLNKVLSKTIHFQWGWIVLLIAIILLLTSFRKEQLNTTSTSR